MKNSKNLKAKYYQKSKVRLEKNKNRQYCQKPQKNLSEGKKTKAS